MIKNDNISADFPLALLRISQANSPIVGVQQAQRLMGKPHGEANLVLQEGKLVSTLPYHWHQQAIELAMQWIPGEETANISCQLNYFSDHRALVEASDSGIAIDVRELPAQALSTLALAWVAALYRASGFSAVESMTAVAQSYRRLALHARNDVQNFLAAGAYDAGHLTAIFLQRAADVEDETEIERWTNWYIGQCRIDLPYDRREVISLLKEEIDPDERRLLMAESVRNYDLSLEEQNIVRLSAETRVAGQELIFGRMSRAFHNQGLLFANAGYVQCNSEVGSLLDEIRLEAAEQPRLLPAVDRMSALLSGTRAAALTAALGAIEIMENVVLDHQRKQLDDLLQAEREERTSALPDALVILARVDKLLALTRRLRLALRNVPCLPAAYVIFSQRFSNTGSHLFARINEAQEPYLGKAENLKMLVRKGGQRLYASPDYRWLHHADHWIEAIPLFIKERVLVVDGVEVTETVIDHQAMEESFREEFAEHWAENINNVQDSEHRALAVEMIGCENDLIDISKMAAHIAAYYRSNAVEIHRLAESKKLTRFDALKESYKAAKNNSEPLEAIEINSIEVQRFVKLADLPRRALPALHVLTTQSARMSDGYIRSWLEESMALYNVCRAYKLEAVVADKIACYRANIAVVGTRLLRELGMWSEVEELMAREQLNEQRAVARIIAGNEIISRQVAIVMVLAENFHSPLDEEPEAVEELLRSKLPELQLLAVPAVFARNEFELLPLIDSILLTKTQISEEAVAEQIILSSLEYADDLQAFARFAAREMLIRNLDATDTTRKLSAQVEQWMRSHTRLAKTTARREALLEAGLNHLTLHPLYYYRATGGNKRFHQLYTPSRVDLGARERESVESWAQWVGGADREAARVGRRLYCLINKNVKMFDSLTEPEVLKTGENASMVAHFSYANAMSLLINSVGRGDIEELGDQMSLRKDRFIHPGGEGYGGYCVPKDGLFLEFVLVLTRAAKLRHLGIADHLHNGIVALAEYLLSRREDFSGELEWEAWAMQLIAERSELADYFTLRNGEDGPVPLFQVTRLAQALTRLGRPEITDPFAVLSTLAARWGVHKIIVGGEQVNRFMPFYKVWLTYQALADSARLNPQYPSRLASFNVMLSAEYKPDTQDGRFSVGMRKFEIFAGTDDHLRYSLDMPGQDLVHLMLQGFGNAADNADPRLQARRQRLMKEFQFAEDDLAAQHQLATLFPGFLPPAEIRMVSPMGLATSDLLHYTSDTNLEAIAARVQQRLLEAGISEHEIAADIHVYGARLEQWARVRQLPLAEREALLKRIGGDIHALALKVLGPEHSCELALQGADVFDTGIPHRDILALLDNPVKVRDLMREGNPHSALVIVDGASGARHRALNRLQVMRWFAAGESIERQAIYRSIGLGAETIESWREEMRRQRERADLLLKALCQGDKTQAENLYAEMIAIAQDQQEVFTTLEEEERMLRFHKDTALQSVSSRVIGEIASGFPLEKLDISRWLALGGQYLVIGMAKEEFHALRLRYEEAMRNIFSESPLANEAELTVLYSPQYLPEVQSFSEEKGVESSNKATEEVAAVAIDTRRHLADRAARARALYERHQAFQQTLVQYAEVSLAELLQRGKEARGAGDCITQGQFGALQAFTRLAIIAFGRELYRPQSAEFAQLAENVQALYQGKEFDELAARAISGGYEDQGELARLGQVIADEFHLGKITSAQRDEKIALLADIAELDDSCRAAALTIDFFVVEPAAEQVWQALTEFFAESINDHWYDYRPWHYSRGTGFSYLQGDLLYQTAVDHHQWQYHYLRNLLLRFTELADLSANDLRQLVGDMATAADFPAIGADAGSAIELRWRAYNQLREIAFIRNDGFPLPDVFAEFDPQIIEANSRVNMLFLFPIGRTHVSRALMEGPTLSNERQAAGKRGINLLITRDVELLDSPISTGRRAAIYDAHLYISNAEYINALQHHRGITAEAAVMLADSKVTPKGVRVAVRFTKPVLAALIFAIHGHPKYEDGSLEEIGLPYASQSLFHYWTTYDKAKYPTIFTPESGVDIPGEIDWLAEYSEELGKEAALQALEFGDPARGFAGLREFARRYSLVMVKDAAESGGRGQKAFSMRLPDDSIDGSAIADAVDFCWQISLKHNVAIQEVIISSPEYWATEEFLRSFVDRQIQEWGAVVNRTRRPFTSIYGSHRLIFSSPDPRSGNWHVSHPITLNSRQLITNVGRGGTLEMFDKSLIRAEFRDLLWQRLEEAGMKSMQALANYGELAADEYRQQTGREIGNDLTGLSYATPRYMMLDFLLQPIFAETGKLVDIEADYDSTGQRIANRFVLLQGESRIYGTVKDWRVVLIEPNIGIGLWDRLAIREEYRYTKSAGQVDWHEVGKNARIVLGDLAQAGEDYLLSLQKME